MAKYKLEYIWLDGYTPLASLRSKTQIKEFASFPKLSELPDWGFDGSSTQQAEGKSSDIVLKPVASFPDSTRKNGVLVMCECYQHTGEPCVTCGAKIRRVLVAQRSSHFCPKCQKR